MFFSLQEVVHAGISVSAIFNYRLTPKVSIAVCYTNCPITIGICIVIYHEWPENRIVIDMVPAFLNYDTYASRYCILLHFTQVKFRMIRDIVGL